MKKTFLQPVRYKIENEKEDFVSARYRTFFYLSAGILSIFAARTLLSIYFPVPRTNDLFTGITLAGSLVILLSRYDQRTTLDWIIGIGAGLLIRWSTPPSAGWLAASLALFAHNFMHFDDLWLQAPWTALGMGLVMALVWGLPPAILSLRRDLESAIAFHWIQDVARFLAGFWPRSVLDFLPRLVIIKNRMASYKEPPESDVLPPISSLALLFACVRGLRIKHKVNAPHGRWAALCRSG